MAHILPGGQWGALVLLTVAEPADAAVKVTVVVAPGEAHVAVDGQTKAGVAAGSCSTVGSELRGGLQPP